MSRLLDLCRNFAKELQLLSNETRLLILFKLLVLGKTSWKTLKSELEKELGHPVNPNLLAFHLRKLVDSGFVERFETENGIYYSAKLPRFYRDLIWSRIVSEAGYK